MALSNRSLITKTGISTTQVFDMGGINISGGDFNLGSNIKLGNASGIITSTNFKTGSSNLHNVGVEVAGVNVLGADTPIGTGATIFNDGSVRFGHTGNNNTGIVTANKFIGDGSGLTGLPAGNLTGTVADARISTLTASKLSGALPAIDGSNLLSLPAGLGTALSQTQTDPHNKIYYTDKVLSISTTTTIDHPATANLAYTQYGDIKIEDGHDLIIKDGDDFKYDILGISTTKIPHNQFPSGLIGDLTGNVTGNITGVVTPSGDVNVGNNIKLGAASGIVTATALVPTTQLSHRNVWINGNFVVAQRGAQQTSVTSISGYATGGPDRCYIVVANHGTFTIKQGTDAPPGFGNCMEMIATTGDSSVASNASVRWWQRFEGQDLQKFAKGTSSAKQFALSFYIKAKQTGTYAFELLDYDSGNRHCVKTYTVDAADTWEYKTIIFPGDTTGPFANDANNSLAAEFWLVAGTDYTSGGTQTTWASLANNKRAGGHTANAFVNNNDYVRITGVQLEVGPVSTPYEHRSYADELRRCQRYFFNITGNTGSRSGIPGYANSTTSLRAMVQFPTPMRAIPTVSGSSTAMILDSHDDSASFNCSSLTAGGAPTTSNPTQMCIEVGTSGMTNGQGGQLEFRAANGFINFSAEL